MSSAAQEIDVATGKVLFDWDSLDHVPLAESQQPLRGGTADTPYDYFHINSVALAPDGDLLVSSRNTWTVYKVARQSGAIRWRLGGKKSGFTDNQGSMQLLPDGRAFVGWGAQLYFSEFAGNGELLLNGQFPLNDQSYRAFTSSWTGHPPGRPAVVMRPNPARGSAVHVSWNGATEVETWTVLAGKSPSTPAAADRSSGPASRR